MRKFFGSVWFGVLTLLFSAQAFAMGAAPMSAHFEEIHDAGTAQLTSLGIRVYYAKNRVEYDLNDVNHEHIHSDALSLPQAIRVAQLIGNEFSQYPAECLRQSGVKKVLITSNMVRSYKLPNQDVVVPVTAAPLFGQGTMVYDDLLLRALSYKPIDSGYRFILNIVNHEYFHYLDFQMGLYISDPDWEEINARSTLPYGNGGDFDRDPASAIWDPSLVGYLDGYSSASINEDRAEVFGGLTAHPDELEYRVATDPIIADKVALMKTEVEQYCPGYRSFWDSEREKLQSRIDFLAALARPNP